MSVWLQTRTQGLKNPCDFQIKEKHSFLNSEYVDVLVATRPGPGFHN